MTADNKALFFRRWSLLIGWADICVVILLGILVLHVAAQTTKRYSDRPIIDDRAEQDGRKLSRMEGQMVDMQQQFQEHVSQMATLNVEGRLSRLETIQDINQKLLIGISIAIALLLIEAAQRRLAKGK